MTGLDPLRSTSPPVAEVAAWVRAAGKPGSLGVRASSPSDPLASPPRRAGAQLCSRAGRGSSRPRLPFPLYWGRLVRIACVRRAQLCPLAWRRSGHSGDPEFWAGLEPGFARGARGGGWAGAAVEAGLAAMPSKLAGLGLVRRGSPASAASEAGIGV